MGRRRPGERLLEVDCVEEGLEPRPQTGASRSGPGGSQHPATLPAHPAATRRWEHVAAWIAALLAVVVVHGGLLAAQVARLDGVPGLAASLHGPVTEVWRVPGELPLGAAGDHLITGRNDGPHLQAVRVADGTLAWTAWAHGEHCELVVRSGPGGVPAVATWAVAPDPDDARVLCLGTAVNRAADSTLRAATGRVLDTATGGELCRVALDTRTASFTRVDDDLVIAGVDPRGRVVALRWSLWTCRTRWTHEGDAPVVTTARHLPETQVQADRLVVVGVRTVALSLASGREVDPAPGEPVDRGQSGVPTRSPGVALEPSLDDGSVPDVVVVRGHDRSPTGLQRATGAVRWRAESAQGAAPLLRIAGVLVLVDGSDVVGVGLRDGTELWRAGSTSPPPGPVSDGRSIVLVERAGEQVALVDRGVRDGLERWRVVLPGPPVFLASLPDGTLLAQIGRDLVALRAQVR
ncbi:MAG TPA: PQQ-binding-like beta-propeller repeat protein [Actinotalea sp.]|nr:PQQ-binding-like beta-propeller repeat protein [Actinotalea sp.]